MEYLGPHNKPKAEVHLEHPPTGPKEKKEPPLQEWNFLHEGKIIHVSLSTVI
jgi:hypothetical protein